jgi:hypothetical protein
MRLHDWLFQVVADACYDRDYLYLVFIRLFTALMNQILDRGRFENSGKYSLPGMKSNLSAQLAWQLEHHLSWMGPNWLQLRCTLTDTLSGVERETERVLRFIHRRNACVSTGLLGFSVSIGSIVIADGFYDGPHSFRR